MSTTKEKTHSPAPWHLSDIWQKPCDTHGLRLASGNLSLAEVYTDIPSADANARLIVCAPELLEALTNLINASDIILSVFDPGPIPAESPTQADLDHGELQYRIDQAKSALALATLNK